MRRSLPSLRLTPTGFLLLRGRPICKITTSAVTEQFSHKRTCDTGNEKPSHPHPGFLLCACRLSLFSQLLKMFSLATTGFVALLALVPSTLAVGTAKGFGSGSWKNRILRHLIGSVLDYQLLSVVVQPLQPFQRQPRSLRAGFRIVLL
jgi:hypothetical protein